MYIPELDISIQLINLPIGVEHPGLWLLDVEVEALWVLGVQTGGGDRRGGAVQVLGVLHRGDQAAASFDLLKYTTIPHLYTTNSKRNYTYQFPHPIVIWFITLYINYPHANDVTWKQLSNTMYKISTVYIQHVFFAYTLCFQRRIYKKYLSKPYCWIINMVYNVRYLSRWGLSPSPREGHKEVIVRLLK